MKDVEKKRLLSEYQHKIRDFQEIIECVLEVPSGNLYPLYDAVQSVQIKNEKLSFQIHQLVLPIDNTKHVRPEGLPVQLQMDFSVEMDPLKLKQFEDPYTQYSFALTLFGELGGVDHSICWHIDRDSAVESDEIHPLYHLQYSDGRTYYKKGEAIDYKWGNSIYLDVPRLVHYPMDLFVGLSFIVTNFYKKDTMYKLHANSIFTHRFSESEDQVLKPYFCAIANKWTNTWPRNLQDYHILCPLLP